MKTEYRAYFFGNMYLSPIQQGIQALHVVSDMFISVDDEYSPLYKWAGNDKTVILLNGGYQSTLLEIYVELKNLTINFNLPVGKFNEENSALNGACTSVGVIVPNYIYDVIDGDIESFFQRLRAYDIPQELHNSCWALNELLKRYKLA